MCNELKKELKKFEVDENKTNSLLKTFNLTLDKLKDKYKITEKLRKLGYKVDIDTSNKKLKKKIEKADKDKIPYIIIIGEDEVKNEYFELKNIKTKETYKIEISNIGNIKK